MENEIMVNHEEIIVKIVTENWRLMKLFMKVITKLDASEANRYLNQIRYFQKNIHDSLNEAGMKLVNLEGQFFDAGMAATPLNIDEFEKIIENEQALNIFKEVVSLFEEHLSADFQKEAAFIFCS